MELVATGKSAAFHTPKTAFQLGIHQLARLNLNTSHDSPFWIYLSNEMLQMRSIPTICTSQMPLTNPHWFSWSKNYCQMTFSDMFLTKICKLMKRYSHRARLQVLCHSLQGPLDEPLSEALWESCSAWQHRCGESVSFHLAKSEMQNCITCPKMWLHTYHLYSFMILTKS